MTNEELWKAVLGEMELSLTRANFITWFKNTTIVARDHSSIIVSVPNGFIKEWRFDKIQKKSFHAIGVLTTNNGKKKIFYGKPKISQKIFFIKFFSKPLFYESIRDT